MSGVLRGFPPSTYFKVRLGRKPLCGLAHRKNPSFMNWKLLKTNFKIYLLFLARKDFIYRSLNKKQYGQKSSQNNLLFY